MTKSGETRPRRAELRRLPNSPSGKRKARTVERAAVVKRYYERFGRRRQTFSSIFAIFAKIFPDFSPRRRVLAENRAIGRNGRFRRTSDGAKKRGIEKRRRIGRFCRFVDRNEKRRSTGRVERRKGGKRGASAFDAALFGGFSGFAVGVGVRLRRIGGSRRRREETVESAARRRRLQPNEERKSDGEEPEADALRNG